jgi:hypothetical protein
LAVQILEPEPRLGPEMMSISTQVDCVSRSRTLARSDVRSERTSATLIFRLVLLPGVEGSQRCSGMRRRPLIGINVALEEQSSFSRSESKFESRTAFTEQLALQLTEMFLESRTAIVPRSVRAQVVNSSWTRTRKADFAAGVEVRRARSKRLPRVRDRL